MYFIIPADDEKMSFRSVFSIWCAMFYTVANVSNHQDFKTFFPSANNIVSQNLTLVTTSLI